jgi:Cu/Ag efflux protein CusF
MKTTTRLATGLLAIMLMTGLITGPALAGQGAHPSGSNSASTQKPSAHRVTGSVVAVDQKARTFTLRDGKGKTYTMKAGTRTAAQLPVLREGERVKVTYEATDGEMVATSISAA